MSRKLYDFIVMFNVALFTPQLRTEENHRSPWLMGFFYYLVSRLMVVAGAGIVAAQRVIWARGNDEPDPGNGLQLITETLNGWDGHWYLEIVRKGYPRNIPADITYFQPEARAAFFPLYPNLVRVVDVLLPGNQVAASLALNLVLGAFVILLIGLIAQRLFGNKVSERTMILLSLFPGSFVLSHVYSEATLLVLAALCFLCLMDKRWFLAGVFAALATASRPNGLALVAACGVACLVAIFEERDWKSIIAPVLAPLGYVGYMVFLRFHTNEPWAWFRVQREAWQEGTSFGGTALRSTFDFLRHPLTSPTDVMTTASLVAVVLLIIAAYKKRLPWMFSAYCAAVLFLMVLPATVTARPRFIFTAFPLFISFAAWTQKDDDKWWPLVITLSAAGLTTVTALYGFGTVVP